jgi:hypothetical protein
MVRRHDVAGGDQEAGAEPAVHAVVIGDQADGAVGRALLTRPIDAVIAAEADGAGAGDRARRRDAEAQPDQGAGKVERPGSPIFGPRAALLRMADLAHAVSSNLTREIEHITPPMQRSGIETMHFMPRGLTFP